MDSTYVQKSRQFFSHILNLIDSMGDVEYSDDDIMYSRNRVYTQKIEYTKEVR